MTLIVGSTTAILSGAWIAQALGAPPVIVRSLIAKSVTTPVAMAVSGEIGGIPELTAVFAIVTGIAGVMASAWLFPRFERPDWRARGFAMGIASTAFGTAHALTLGATAEAFSSHSTRSLRRSPCCWRLLSSTTEVKKANRRNGSPSSCLALSPVTP